MKHGAEPKADDQQPAAEPSGPIPSGAGAPADTSKWALILLAAFAGIWLLQWARAVCIPIILGVLISYALSPFVNRLQQWRIARAERRNAGADRGAPAERPGFPLDRNAGRDGRGRSGRRGAVSGVFPPVCRRHLPAQADQDRGPQPQQEADSGEGPGRAASLAARFAAKEACVKLFPREAALGQIEPADFSVARDNYGAPQAVLSATAQAVLARHRLSGIALSLTHDRTTASAVALATPSS